MNSNFKSGELYLDVVLSPSKEEMKIKNDSLILMRDPHNKNTLYSVFGSFEVSGDKEVYYYPYTKRKSTCNRVGPFASKRKAVDFAVQLNKRIDLFLYAIITSKSL